MTPEQLRSLLDYIPETGALVWRHRPNARKEWNNKYAGTIAGTLALTNRVQLLVRNRLYLAHRLAWFHVHGVWPDGELDHINGNPWDNRIANLRLATRMQQLQNSRRRSDNTSGFKGVWWENRRKHWVAEIMHDGRKHHLGAFLTAEDAHAARVEAARRLHGKFARYR
jgi:hypothetical protein